jgi:hypothetical protein
MFDDDGLHVFWLVGQRLEREPNNGPLSVRNIVFGHIDSREEEEQTRVAS